MRPIPKNLLIHEVTLHKLMKADEFYDEGVPDAGMVLKHVRLEPSSKIVRGKDNAEIQLAATMFYDCKNSEPQNVAFQVDDIIVFHEQKHQVKVVEPLYDGRKLHHYELGLIKYA